MLMIDSKVIDPNELIRKIKSHVGSTDLKFEDTRKNKEFSNSSFDGGEIDREFSLFKGHVYELHNLYKIYGGEIYSQKKIIGPMVVLFKRVMRKIGYIFTKPFINQQNQFNSVVVQTISDHMRIQEEILKHIRTIESANANISIYSTELDNKIVDMRREFSELEEIIKNRNEENITKQIQIEVNELGQKISLQIDNLDQKVDLEMCNKISQVDNKINRKLSTMQNNLEDILTLVRQVAKECD
jgi:hypothetical protein